MIARASGKVGGRQVKLTLEATLQDPTPKGGHIQLALKVESGKEGDPVASEEVVFSRQIDGVFEDISAITDDQGRAGHLFRDFGLGQHTLKARYDSIIAAATITIGEEKLQVVAEVNSGRVVQGNVHALSITLLSEKGIGMPGRLVRVFDSLTPVVAGANLKSIETTSDSSGVVTRVYAEGDTERKITFDVVGTKHVVDFTIPASAAVRKAAAEAEAQADEDKKKKTDESRGPSLRERMRTQFDRGRGARPEGGAS